MNGWFLSLVLRLMAGLILYFQIYPSGDYIEDLGVTSFVMKEIPGGSFMMGCGVEDEPCSNEEKIDKSGGRSQHHVTVESFYMGETEVTWAVYQQCIDGGFCQNNDFDGGDNGWGKDDRPVIEVSWNEVIQDFIPWLNQETGKNYYLPSEAEWEYAARAGTTTKYSWGNEINCSQARYGYHVDQCGKQAGTMPVKSYEPNAFGLYDMHGNVWEFVQDCWGSSQESKTDSIGNNTCQEIVLRGGSWLNEPLFLGSAARYRHDRTYRESGDGFRLAHKMK